jgi:hypothetical protein
MRDPSLVEIICECMCISSGRKFHSDIHVLSLTITVNIDDMIIKHLFKFLPLCKKYIAHVTMFVNIHSFYTQVTLLSMNFSVPKFISQMIELMADICVAVVDT